MSDLQVVMTAVIVVAALALELGALALRREGETSAIVAVALALALLLWMPETGRDAILWTLALLLALLLVPGSWFVRATTAAIVAPILWLLGKLPGGLTTGLLAVLALIAVARVRSLFGHLVRIRRAAKLVAGELAARDVELGGEVAGKPVALPVSIVRGAGALASDGSRGADAPELAAWWAWTRGDRRVVSGPLYVQTPSGLALCELDYGTLAFSAARTRTLSAETTDELAAQLAMLLGSDPARGIQALETGHGVSLSHGPTLRRDAAGAESARADGDPGGGATEPNQIYTLHWLPPGAPVYVIGRPEWDRAPVDAPGFGAGYRDAPCVPVFRGRDVYIADSSATEARDSAVWSVATWLVWGGVCSAVAGLQLAGTL